MAKRNKSHNHPKNLQELVKQKQDLENLELFMIEKALNSSNPHAYIEARTHIKNIQESKKNELRSFTYSPMVDYYGGKGYKYKPQGLNYQILRNMSNTPQIKAIINTRVEQAGNFNQFTLDTQKPGWVIRKKRNIFDNDGKELTNVEKREIKFIVDFLESGGGLNTWDFDGWESFTRKLFEDSWTLDQGVFEVSIDRIGRPTSFDVYDGGTFHLAEHKIRNEEDAKRLDAYMINGYLPRYVQVFSDKVYHEYYPWELCFGIRNATTNYHLNGYGLSENEVLIQVITWMLNSNQYNGNFFQQGSNPKGILNFKDNVDTTQLEAFKQNWRNTLSGVGGAHKLAAISGGTLEWINMQLSNRDMEFHQWLEFLTVLACTVFRIDPSEVGFTFDGQKGIFGQDGQKERLRHSKEKGLEPFLKFWQKKFSKYIVGPLSGGKYEFVFTGLEPDDEEATLDRDVKILSNGGMSVQDFFMKYSDREVDLNKDILLNQILLAYKQLQMQGTPEANKQVDDDSGESHNNPYKQKENGDKPKEDEKEKSIDPFTKAANDYLNNFLKDV